MERPNTKQLEQALCFADTGELSEAEGKWLAAEVRALREELASENSEARRIFTSEFKAELLERTQECDRLRATIARVEARADVWAASSRKWNGLGCAQDVRVALKGTP